MMEDGRQPPELDRLERLLASGPRPEPSPALRERVLNGALCRLRRQQMLLLAWASAATVAATVLLSVGFSYLFLAAFFGNQAAPRAESGGITPVEPPAKTFVVTSVPGIGLTVVASNPSVPLSTPELAWRIRLLSPEISPEEATRQAVLLQIGAMTGAQSTLADQLRKLNIDDPHKHVRPDSR
jgi:hypothetical protein